LHASRRMRSRDRVSPLRIVKDFWPGSTWWNCSAAGCPSKPQMTQAPPASAMSIERTPIPPPRHRVDPAFAASPVPVAVDHERAWPVVRAHANLWAGVGWDRRAAHAQARRARGLEPVLVQPMTDGRGAAFEHVGDVADREFARHDLAEQLALDGPTRGVARRVRRVQAVLSRPIRHGRWVAPDLARDRFDRVPARQPLRQPLPLHDTNISSCVGWLGVVPARRPPAARPLTIAR
jgi:hypothetical protein